MGLMLMVILKVRKISGKFWVSFNREKRILDWEQKIQFF